MAGGKYTKMKYTRPEDCTVGAGVVGVDMTGGGFRQDGDDEGRAGGVEGLAGTELNRENFETYIGVAMSKEDIMLCFGVDKKTIDKWCWKEYHMSFDSAYSLILRLAQKELMAAFVSLAARGNPTAMQIAKEAVLKMGAELGAETKRFVFVNDIPKKEG